MYLRARLEAQAETLSDFVVAAEQRFWEGMELAVAGHLGSGIYLMGFAAEMYLKVASFRFDGALLTDPVEPRLAPARTWMRLNRPNVAHESYHSLLFWMEYLRGRRAAAAAALPSDVDGSLSHHVRRLYQVWWVEMRYRGDDALDWEAERVRNSVSWLREHIVVLAR